MNVKCTSCGAQQDLAATSNCSYCGNTIELSQGQAAYTTMMQGEVGNLVVMADTAVEAGNWEEALQYYNRILEKQITNSDAWLGKGIAMVNTSTIGTMKVTEAIAYWKNAVKHAPDQAAMGKRVAKEIDRVVSGFYPVLENHYVKHRTVADAYRDLAARFMILESAQDYATQLATDNVDLCMTGYELCKRVIEVPTRYTTVDDASALLEGMVGQLSSNEYTRKRNVSDAIDKRNEAKKRRNEIEVTQKEVIKIQQKYIQGIKKINPQSDYIQSLLPYDDRNPELIKFVKENYSKHASKDDRSKRSIIRQEIIDKYGSKLSLVEAMHVVDKILVQEKLISQNDINEWNRENEKSFNKFLIIAGISIVILLLLINC